MKVHIIPPHRTKNGQNAQRRKTALMNETLFFFFVVLRCDVNLYRSYLQESILILRLPSSSCSKSWLGFFLIIFPTYALVLILCKYYYFAFLYFFDFVATIIVVVDYSP